MQNDAFAFLAKA